MELNLPHHFCFNEDLEKNPLTKMHPCLQTFLQKGGTIRMISELTESNRLLSELILTKERKESSSTGNDAAIQSQNQFRKKPNAPIELHEGDAVYPICSGGWCRSQTLWAILQSFQIILFPPHAARMGWDPYNGHINRYQNYVQEEVYDEFSSYFGIEKSLRFGFEHSSEWKLIEKSPTKEGLQKITQFYNEYYFGPNSSWKKKQGKKRIYIAFSNNAHITLYRLNQTNENLNDVTVVSIAVDDLITYPPSFLNTTSRSVDAYHYFSNLLKQQFIFSNF